MKNSAMFDNTKLDCQIIILAAGNGSRMSSSLPKVMHQVDGKPMIERVLDNCASVSGDIVLVYSQILLEHLTPYKHLCKLALQESPKGTAHAVDAAREYFSASKPIMVIYGDNPLITADIIQDLAKHQRSTNSAAVTLAFDRNDPAQYGRIVTDEHGKFLKIVEHKNATDMIRKITLCNSGIMVFAPGILQKYLPYCLEGADPATELYLTKIIEVCAHAGEKVTYFKAHNADLVLGVNTQEELLEAAMVLKNLK
jgi:UDP-N-acetylglucosamine pyrophosphorylase